MVRYRWWCNRITKLGAYLVCAILVTSSAADAQATRPGTPSGPDSGWAGASPNSKKQRSTDDVFTTKPGTATGPGSRPRELGVQGRPPSASVTVPGTPTGPGAPAA